MKHSTFKLVRNSLDRLSTSQFREVKETIESIDSVKFVSKIIETERNSVTCPHCKSVNLQRWGKVSDLQRYRCKECRRTFNNLTNTPMARLKKKGRWFEYAKCINDGVSLRQAAERCEVSVKTSFHWRHRFLMNSRLIKPKKMSGIVEIKEFDFPLSFKGSLKDYLDYRAKCNKPLSQQKVSVIFTKDRYRNTYDEIVFKLNKENLIDSLKPVVTNDTLICSENKSVFNGSFSELGFRHGKLDIKHKEFVKKDIVHIRNAFTYNKLLVKWMERFHGVATKYLESYLSWYRFLDEFNMVVSPVKILHRAKHVEKYNHQ